MDVFEFFKTFGGPLLTILAIAVGVYVNQKILKSGQDQINKTLEKGERKFENTELRLREVEKQVIRIEADHDGTLASLSNKIDHLHEIMDIIKSRLQDKQDKV